MSSPVSIALFGLSGALGAATLEALQSSTFASKVQFPIKAISRKELKSTEKVQYIQSDLTDVESLSKALAGTDVIIELLGPNPVTFGAVEKVVASVKPKLFVPSQFGVDIPEVEKYAPGFLGLKAAHSKAVRETGQKVADIITGLFAIPGTFLYEIVGAVGVDPEAKTYTVKGSLDAEFSISTEGDIGRTIASLVTSDISKIPDTVKVYSEKVSFRKVISTYEKNHDVKLTESKSQTAEEALAEFKTEWASGFDPTKFLYYLQVIASQGLDKGANIGANQRELVNPGEKLWKWEKF